jgi:hypothetical protein
MSLARIMSGPAGCDQCTFECGKCEYVYRQTFTTTPMKSDKAGWLVQFLGLS